MRCRLTLLHSFLPRDIQVRRRICGTTCRKNRQHRHIRNRQPSSPGKPTSLEPPEYSPKNFACLSPLHQSSHLPDRRLNTGLPRLIRHRRGHLPQSPRCQKLPANRSRSRSRRLSLSHPSHLRTLGPLSHGPTHGTRCQRSNGMSVLCRSTVVHGVGA